MEKSERVYKFGGGEWRPSKGVISLPCNLGGVLDVIDADLPLLIGNSTLKKGFAVIHCHQNKLGLLGKELDLMETNSGHYSLQVRPPKGKCSASRGDTVCLAMSNMEELNEKEVFKLHHYQAQ